jgi:hypothetical protein
MDCLKDRRLIELCRYWAAKRRGGALPGRRDVDPMELRALLPHLFLLDVVRSTSLLFRFRLVGTALVELSGRDLTGETIGEEQYGAGTDWILDTLGRVAREAAPVAQRIDMGWTGRPVRRAEVAFLPLASDGHTVNMILGGMVRTAVARPAGCAPGQAEPLVIPWDASSARGAPDGATDRRPCPLTA